MPQLPPEAAVRSQAILSKYPRDSLSNDSDISTKAEFHTSNMDSIELLLAAAERSNNLPLPDQIVLYKRSLIATETLPAGSLAS
ncbi:hypothetical protein OCU04_012207 [Sclerotinia nivalis]|uniref:Uncharacterized protein n=1 Tax=Sclerotinia nivalis TaxID=352851 RepID=A0A9X0DFW1_9HELO|nr:hypothetical protein OCU04_012207 [Sclerotinia nivalis]